jgi:hypothetical protein
MKLSRTLLMSGVAVVTATAVAVAPPVPPRPAEPTPAATIHVVAAPAWLLAESAPIAAVNAPVAAQSIGSGIIDVYNAVQPWVAYGVSLAAYAVGWIPVIGIFAPQITIIYGSLVQPITQSVVYNFANFLDGNISFLQGLGNIGSDTVNAIGGLVSAEINWLLSFLPPLPPLPPLLAAAVRQPSGAVSAVANSAVVKPVAPQQTTLTAHVGAVTNPVPKTALNSRAIATTSQNVTREVHQALNLVVGGVKKVPVTAGTAGHKTGAKK